MTSKPRAKRKPVRSQGPAAQTPQSIAEHARAKIPLIVLIALAVGCMLPAINAGFVWDDIYLTRSKTVPELAGLVDIWLSPRSHLPEIHYWPVTYSSFWLEYRFWGFWPAGFHIVNLLLHAAVTCLVWNILVRLDVPGAWLAAAIFAVHPVHVEAAAWVIGRKDLLAALLYLISASLWIRLEFETPRNRLGVLVGAVAVYGLAILSKTTAVTLPAGLAILYWWKCGNLSFKLVRSLLPFVIVGGLVAGGETYYYHSQGEVGIDLTVAERLIVASKALLFYTGKLLVPVNLTNVYPLWEIHSSDPVQWLYPAAVVAALLLLWSARSRIGHGPLAATLFFILTLIPVSGLFNSSFMLFSYVADRYQYVASISLIATFSACAWQFAKIAPRAAVYCLAALAAAGIGILGYMSWQQTYYYRDDISFFQHVLDHNPDARTANYLLGKAYSRAGRHEEALSHSLIGAERLPDNYTSNLNAGLTLFNLRRHKESLPYFERARGIREPGDSFQQALSYIASGGALERGEEANITERLNAAHARFLLDDIDLARSEVEQAFPLLDTEEDRLRATMIHGKIDYAGNRFAQAENRFEQSAVIAADAGTPDAEILFHLGLSRMRQGKFPVAIQAFEDTLKISPQDRSAIVNLGEALLGAGRFDDAVPVFQDALELDPYDEAARAGLQAAFAKRGNE